MSILRTRNNSRGSVLTEFAIVAPLLMFLMLSLVELGRLLFQASWVSQAAYLSALLGGQSPVGSGLEIMQRRLDLLAAYRQSEFSAFHISVDTISPGLNQGGTPLLYDASQDLIGIRLNGNISSVSNLAPKLNMGVSLTAPHLLAGSVDTLAADGQTNPAVLFDCDGDDCTDPLSECGSNNWCGFEYSRPDLP